MTIRYEVQADGAGLLATVSGRLRLTDAAPLRERMLKCLAEQPEALLLDISGLYVDQPLVLAMFTVVLRQAARWPGTPVLFCAPPPETRELMRAGAYHWLPIFDSVEAARGHLRDHRSVMPVISEDLLPVSGSSRHARDVATETCLRWDLPDLVAPASLIVTELVANVVDHAHTMMSLQLTLRDRYLNISLRDGATAPPIPPGPAGGSSGRGLLLVAAVAHAWGWLPTDGGKVVWASLRW